MPSERYVDVKLSAALKRHLIYSVPLAASLRSGLETAGRGAPEPHPLPEGPAFKNVEGSPPDKLHGYPSAVSVEGGVSLHAL